MELREVRTLYAHQMVTAIIGELANRGVTLRQRDALQNTDAGGYANCYILDGTVSGGLISVSLTKQLDELELVWGPYFLPKHGLQYVSFRAYSFDALVQRLNKEIKKASRGSNRFGLAALETWFTWMYTGPKKLQQTSETFCEILDGERTTITIHDHLVQKLTPGMKAVLADHNSAVAKAFLTDNQPK